MLPTTFLTHRFKMYFLPSIAPSQQIPDDSKNLYLLACYICTLFIKRVSVPSLLENELYFDCCCIF